MALIRNIVLYLVIRRSVETIARTTDWRRAGLPPRKSNRTCVSAETGANSNEVLFLHPRGAVAARVEMRDAAPDGMRLSG